MNEVFQEITQAIEEGFNSIFSDPWMILMQLIATTLLFVIVRVFLWKPITKFLDQRQKAVNRELYEAHFNNQRSQQLKMEMVQEHELAKAETQAMREILQKEAYSEKDRIISEARAEVKRRLDQVEYDIRQEVKHSQDKIRQSIKEIAFAAAEKIVQYEIDETQHEDMINELIEEKFR